MGFLQDMILLAHPIVASLLLYWFYRQYKWKMKRIENPDSFTLENHVKNGRLLAKLATIVVIIAFAANVYNAHINQQSLLDGLTPNSLHGWTGPLGLVLLWSMVLWGESALKQKQNGESYQHSKSKHSRAADFIITVMAIHAFLRFLYVFVVI